jgi:hypothetical protein
MQQAAGGLNQALAQNLAAVQDGVSVPGENDIGAQRQMMYDEPYVQRTQEFFYMVKESYGVQSEEFTTFKQLIH